LYQSYFGREELKETRGQKLVFSSYQFSIKDTEEIGRISSTYM